MAESVLPKDLNMGSMELPEPLLPLIICLIPLDEIYSVIDANHERHGMGVTEDGTEFLEGELIDDNLDRLGLVPIAIVEWGPDCSLGEEHYASVYTLPMHDVGELVVVRWWGAIPHWWSYGESTELIDTVIEALERGVGRTCNRIVWHRAETQEGG